LGPTDLVEHRREAEAEVGVSGVVDAHQGLNGAVADVEPREAGERAVGLAKADLPGIEDVVGRVTVGVEEVVQGGRALAARLGSVALVDGLVLVVDGGADDLDDQPLLDALERASMAAPGLMGAQRKARPDGRTQRLAEVHEPAGHHGLTNAIPAPEQILI
jgi:hypothetical protein